MNTFFSQSQMDDSVVDVISLKETANDDLEGGRPLDSSTSSRRKRYGRNRSSKAVSIYSNFDRQLDGASGNNNSNSNGDGNGHIDTRTTDGNSSTSEGHSSVISFFLRFRYRRHTNMTIALILVLGIVSSAALLAIGITSARSQQSAQFERNAQDMVKTIETRFHQYVMAASLVHNFCSSRNFTRPEFRQMYEYLQAGSLEFKAVQFDPNITREQRPLYEQEAREYYAENYPHINYRGFVGFEQGVANGLLPRSEQDYYFPIHYMEPIIGNEAAIDLDYYSHISRRQSLEYSLTTGLPSVTERLVLVKDDNVQNRCGAGGDASYGVVLFHPGVNSTAVSAQQAWPKDVATIVICIPSLLGLATEGQNVLSAVYLYDIVDGEDIFLGGVNADGKETDLEFLPPADFTSLRKDNHLFYSQETAITNRVWHVAVVPLPGEYKANLIFVILGGSITLLGSIFLAYSVWSTTKRIARFNEIRADSEAEKASLILENARQATRAERELNDFIGHEVRNPVAAAMTACSFVKTAVNKQDPMSDDEARESVREDVEIIDNSLKFVNDLLRNMLDMHRASNKQLKVKMSATDILHDVLEPVGGMLHQRNSRYEVLVDCPEGLLVMADSLRLKQVILNLGRNSSKFISEGFIRLRAAEVDGNVQLSVDDSGSGIPKEKRDKMFSKFQESLDVLSQGTGIGLFLCKNLTELMGGKIYLDEDYDSGIEGHPGTRFVIDMQAPALDAPSEAPSMYSNRIRNGSGKGKNRPSAASVSMAGGVNSAHLEYEEVQQLPESCSVLFVDDDAILRKLFCRSVKYVSPNWTVRQAASGEAALRLIETGESFDLIFVDMYMASVEKQLLGTETVVELRSRGIDCRICGLSANDKEKEFLEAGADAFSFKPFPCEKSALQDELRRVLFSSTESSTDSDSGRPTTTMASL